MRAKEEHELPQAAVPGRNFFDQWQRSSDDEFLAKNPVAIQRLEQVMEGFEEMVTQEQLSVDAIKMCCEVITSMAKINRGWNQLSFMAFPQVKAGDSVTCIPEITLRDVQL